MADYKIVDAEQLNAALDDLAKSIRTKSGVKGDLAFPDPNEFKSAVDIIETIINDTRPNVITENGTHETDGYSHINVNVQPSDEYIKKSDTWLYTTRFAYGTHAENADTPIAKTSITEIGFKPKVFFLRNQSSVSLTTASSRYYVTASVMVVDNNYNFAIVSQTVSSNNTVSTRTAVASGYKFYSPSTGKYAGSSLQSNGLQNVFSPTDGGVAGNGADNTDAYLKKGVEYFWFAWG